MSLAIFHPHFSIRILSSAFFHPHFIIRIFLSAIRHRPSSGPHFTETRTDGEPTLLKRSKKDFFTCKSCLCFSELLKTTRHLRRQDFFVETNKWIYAVSKRVLMFQCSCIINELRLKPNFNVNIMGDKLLLNFGAKFQR